MWSRGRRVWIGEPGTALKPTRQGPRESGSSSTLCFPFPTRGGEEDTRGRPHSLPLPVKRLVALPIRENVLLVACLGLALLRTPPPRVRPTPAAQPFWAFGADRSRPSR